MALGPFGLSVETHFSLFRKLVDFDRNYSGVVWGQKRSDFMEILKWLLIASQIDNILQVPGEFFAAKLSIKRFPP